MPPVPYRLFPWVFLILILIPPPAGAVTEDDLLKPEQAFVLTVSAPVADWVVAEWAIAGGYSLYRERFRFASTTPGVELQEPRFPAGIRKDDPWLGPVEIYRDRVRVELPIVRTQPDAATLELRITAQGCADRGVCYPPQIQTVAVKLLPAPPAAAPPARVPAADPLQSLMQRNTPLPSTQDGLLEPDQAFIFSVTAAGPRTLTARWDIADGYYLYQNKIQFRLLDAGRLRIEGVELPSGTVQEDEFFGRQEVLHHQAIATVHLQGDAPADGFDVRTDYQGCAEIGVCYPPINQTLPVRLPVPTATPAAPLAVTAKAEPLPAAPAGDNTELAEQDRMAGLLQEQHFWALPAFFGFGLLLAFTPCVFPMIPILSGLIVGEGKTATPRRAFLLSLAYVLAMAATYTVAGVMAALLGRNVQALFQNPVVLAGFSLLFVTLALAMFDVFQLQLPSQWQTRLADISNRHPRGHYWGAALMGVFSALIVGPCVAPPLIGVLTVIAGTGDVLLGGAALFMLALGMGMPLLLIGASAGRLLPKAGAWMEPVKAVFGVLLLAVAIWIVERIVPAAVAMLLWAALLIVCATFLGALQPLVHGAPAWRVLVKGVGVVLLVYGILLLVGVAAGGKDPLQPLRGVSFGAGGTVTAAPLFRRIKTVADLQRELQQANGRPVLLDFYADWCVSCQELEKYTFGSPAVQAALAPAVRLQADVTANDADDRALLRHAGVIGPPAVLFFGPDGRERRTFRLVGFLAAEPFRAHAAKALGS